MNTLEVTTDAHVAWVAMARPKKLNAINAEMRRDFAEAFAEIERDDDVKVVVLSGQGERAFSAGADLAEAGKRTSFERRRDTVADAASVVRRCGKPVIAMLHGFALGGGAELATTCDVRIAADDLVIGYPEIKHGWLPAGGGGTQTLPRLVGMGRAMLLVLTGDNLGADEAKAVGLVDEVVPRGELEARCGAIAASIAQHELKAILLGKSALRMTERSHLDAGLEYEREIATLCYTFEGRQEALQAFHDRKRGA